MHNESAKLAVRYNRLQFLFEVLKLYCVTGIWKVSEDCAFSCLISLADIGKVTWLMRNSFPFLPFYLEGQFTLPLGEGQ